FFFDDFLFAAAFFPPLFEAPGLLAILAARSLDMPLSRSPSYCLRFLIVPVRLPGIAISFRSSGPSSGSVRGVRAAESTAHVGDEALHVAVSSLFEVLLGERQAVGAIDPEGGELIR